MNEASSLKNVKIRLSLKSLQVIVSLKFMLKFLFKLDQSHASYFVVVPTTTNLISGLLSR